MTVAADEPDRSGLVCVAVTGARAPLAVLEALSRPREELPGALPDLHRRAGVAQLCLINTCERVEVYAYGEGGPDAAAVVRALATARGVPEETVREAADVLTGREAARHLLRVAAGLESFVLGESDIVGQVRSAAAASQEAGVGGLELERLVASAVSTSRRVRAATSFGESGRSVAAAAVGVAAQEYGGDLAGRSVLVVGGGEVAAQAVDSATRAGATVTVCARTRRRAERLADAGAVLVPLDRLLELLPSSDVVIFATASPEPLLESASLGRALVDGRHSLLVLDLCVPRNVHPAVRDVPGVRLLDLADLRAMSAVENEHLSGDVARAERVVEDELDRYHQWSARRSAAASVRKLREDLDACVRMHTVEATRGVPEDLRPVVAESIRRGLHQLAHGPTRRLMEAAEAGDDRLVEILGGIFSRA
jgi:glutamyl-tRNA reductase